MGLDREGLFVCCAVRAGLLAQKLVTISVNRCIHDLG